MNKKAKVLISSKYLIHHIPIDPMKNYCSLFVSILLLFTSKIFAQPTVFTVTGGGSFCSGGTGVHIGLSNSELGVEYHLYQGSTVVSTTAGTGLPLDMGLYTIPGLYTAKGTTVTDTVDMTGYTIIAIDPVLKPMVSLSVVGGDTVCEGYHVTLVAGSVNGGYAPVYTWFVNGIIATAGSAFTYTYKPVNGDIVSVKLKSNATCSIPDTVFDSTTLTVVPVFAPNVTITRYPAGITAKGKVVTFTALATDAGSSPTYHWSVNNIPINLPSYITVLNKYTSTQLGEMIGRALEDNDSVSCEVTSNGICAGTKSSSSIILHYNILGVNTTVANDLLAIYPNPASDELIIEGAEGSEVQIFNVVGTSVNRLTITENKEVIDITKLVPGVYLLRAVDGSTGLTMTRRFVKE
jgi:Secretion system C-terminal sorting domain